MNYSTYNEQRKKTPWGQNMQQEQPAPELKEQPRQSYAQKSVQNSAQQRTGVYAGYDPVSDTAYQNALAALQEAEKNTPTYTPTYDAQINDLYSRIVNRDKFSYDLNSDALYQQMKDQYVQQGKIAMMDTMGQAAAMTGGYGSSYGQSVGQQTYNAYLQQLNDNLPAYYDRAYQQYQDEGNALTQQYGLTGDLADREYAKYQDAYNRWLNERSYASDAEQAAYARGLNAWQNQYAIEQDLYNRSYQEQQDAYSRLMTLISTYGYNPSNAEIAAAGLTRAQVNAMLSAINSSGSSGGGGGTSTWQTKEEWINDAAEAYTNSKNGINLNEISKKALESGFAESELRDVMAAVNTKISENNKNKKTPENVFGRY